MTVRVVLACDGEQALQPCRQAIPTGAVADVRDARLYAQTQGWSTGYRSGATFHDLCPSCTKREQEGRA